MTVCQNMHKNGRGGHSNNKDKIAAEAAKEKRRMKSKGFHPGNCPYGQFLRL